MIILKHLIYLDFEYNNFIFDSYFELVSEETICNSKIYAPIYIGIRKFHKNTFGDGFKGISAML